MDAARELAHKHNDKLLIEHLNFIKEVWKASENKNPQEQIEVQLMS